PGAGVEVKAKENRAVGGGGMGGEGDRQGDGHAAQNGGKGTKSVDLTATMTGGFSQAEGGRDPWVGAGTGADVDACPEIETPVEGVLRSRAHLLEALRSYAFLEEAASTGIG
ncbi:unnamed protein product, partial [Discosporangium mesarthrocarpum]